MCVLFLAILTITQQQDAAKPATDLAFPSVTICSPGLNMEAVKEAIANDFKKWKEEEGRSKEDIDEFMEEKYAMKVGEGNIFEKIRAGTRESTGSNALVDNIVTCKANNGRRKRETMDAGLILEMLKHPKMKASHKCLCRPVSG